MVKIRDWLAPRRPERTAVAKGTTVADAQARRVLRCSLVAPAGDELSNLHHGGGGRAMWLDAYRRAGIPVKQAP